MSLHNKKVKIKVDDIIKREESPSEIYLTETFLKFINDNKDKVFTAQEEEKYNFFYSLKENDDWIFFETDLELV